ncbi:MAG: M1 family metallopeptidase [Chitinophagaceae bacterium]|nr:M1 family metallopeptidase [Chitinophagaceae bacterium]MCA6454345.1 M1 family metallopeptidase [Chitinophagaceae bacterium]MCA6455910.1 M1 family metallopeptidase [Chitinophagaceae bacterium]MCA6458572.1 M1 family metallopeptidase [Chitinophagaceae bacterium]MCA6465012.1 M1 family metallopeptidase [Chitinophagaceae bacterium]
MNTKIRFLLLAVMCSWGMAQAQLGVEKEVFTKADTLRGSLNENRTWWDVLYYSIGVTPDFTQRTIKGKVDISFKVLRPGKTMQIDLQEPLQLTKAYLGDTKLTYQREGNVYWIDIPMNLVKGSTQKLALAYEGSPKIAKRAPWDGGWIFQKDEKGRPWMTVACQGLGASVWYPCKDHQSDEPDNGATMLITVPDTLIAVANGRLISRKSYSPGNLTWRWEVKNPINNYNLVPYIGKYVNFTDTLMGEKGKLDLSYWVLDYNLDKAKEQFKQAKTMLRAFEYWMGPYPFYEDGYKLVESPHLGMEHQSAVAYGNKYQNGYLGRDLSGSGWGLKWDFIIVHESGHEWFANSITSKDLADMWIHEGFTNYSETLFTEYVYGKQAGNEYNYGTRRGIQNDKPIIGPYGVNKEGSGDMYPKSGNMLHSIRHAMNDDEKFRDMLRYLGRKFYHQTVTTEDIQEVVSQYFGSSVTKIFDQYLRTTQVPVFEYSVSADQRTLSYRYTNCVDGFNLPIFLNTPKGGLLLGPESNKWNTKELKPGDWAAFPIKEIEKNYYVVVKQGSL